MWGSTGEGIIRSVGRAKRRPQETDSSNLRGAAARPTPPTTTTTTAMKNIKVTTTKKDREIDVFGVSIHDSDRDRALLKLEGAERAYQQIQFDTFVIAANDGTMLQLQPTTNGFHYYILRKTEAGTKNCYPASCFMATFNKKTAILLMLTHAMQQFGGIAEMYGSLKWGAENCMQEALDKHNCYMQSVENAKLVAL